MVTWGPPILRKHQMTPGASTSNLPHPSPHLAPTSVRRATVILSVPSPSVLAGSWSEKLCPLWLVMGRRMMMRMMMVLRIIVPCCAQSIFFFTIQYKWWCHGFDTHGNETMKDTLGLSTGVNMILFKRTYHPRSRCSQMLGQHYGPVSRVDCNTPSNKTYSRDHELLGFARALAASVLAKDPSKRWNKE